MPQSPLLLWPFKKPPTRPPPPLQLLSTVCTLRYHRQPSSRQVTHLVSSSTCPRKGHRSRLRRVAGGLAEVAVTARDGADDVVIEVRRTAWAVNLRVQKRLGRVGHKGHHAEQQHWSPVDLSLRRTIHKIWLTHKKKKIPVWFYVRTSLTNEMIDDTNNLLLHSYINIHTCLFTSLRHKHFRGVITKKHISSIPVGSPRIWWPQEIIPSHG